MTELELPKNTHMGGWFIDEKICDDIIQSYDNNSSKSRPGEIYDNTNKPIIDKSWKHSFDIPFPADTVFSPYSEYLNELQKVLELYLDKFPHVNEIQRFQIRERVYVQKYPAGGGFKKWHFEEPGPLQRCLVFMTYLNDLTDEGGTEFLYQDLKIKPQKGLTLIWPAYWTHTHRGVVSKTQEKYIVTGWYSNY